MLRDSTTHFAQSVRVRFANVTCTRDDHAYASSFVVGLARYTLVVALLVVGAAPARAASANVSIHTGGLQLGSVSLRDVTVTVHTGELAFRGNGTDVQLVRGFAMVQRGGELRITDPVLRASLVSAFRDRLAIQQRLASTLSDFAYSTLAMTFGADPLIHISIRGRGKRVAQDLYLAVNLRKPS